MSTYTYSVTSDFLLVSEVNTTQLRTEILEETSITTTLSRIDQTGDAVDIVFVSSLPGGEETTLDNLVANYLNIVDEEEDLTEAFIQNNLSENKLLLGSASLKTGLTFNVTTCSYIINGDIYESDPDEITLDTADPTNPRIDVIVVNTDGDVDKITGTPAADPEEPDVDDNTQIKVTAITVEAGASTPGTITLNNMYFENLGTGSGEWDATENTSGVRINVDSTNNPKSGSKCIEVTGGQTDDAITLTNSSIIDSTTISLLEFHIRSKATWDDTRRVKVAFYNGSTRVSEWVSVKNGSYDFQSIITTGYQIIIIPGTKFIFSNPACDNVRIKVAGSGSNIGFYIDEVRLQGGLPLQDSATGEANTASNVGDSGTGIFKQKLGPDLEFYKLNAGSGTTIGVNTGTGTIDIAVSTGSIDHNNILNVGTNTHDQIDAHIAASSGVHGVSGTLVGTTDTQILTNKTIDADSNTITNIEDADIKTGAAINAEKIADGSVTNTEFQYINSLTSNVQTQIDNHIADTSTHGVTGNIVGTTDTQILTNKTFGDEVIINSTTQSTSVTTGALVVDGGIGIAKNVNIGGDASLDGQLTLGTGTNSYNFPNTIGSTNQVLSVSSTGSLLFTNQTVDASTIDHTQLLNIGTNTHEQIDNHISSVANPHNVLATQITDFDTEVSNNDDVSKNTEYVNVNLQDNVLLSGSASWDTGLIFNVTECIYVINQVLYTSTAGQVVLDVADGSNPRIDVIVVNTSGNIDKVTGTPSGSPVKPEVDSETQIEVTFILVNAGQLPLQTLQLKTFI